ncbi:MAG: glycosyltransferase family 4 protein [Nitrospinota bacterium]|nr:glycosyltransferase family 4 protein [Nitrospinota bacterium]
MRQLKIIQVISSPWWTGPAEPVLFLTDALGKRGHNMHFVCVGGDALEAQAEAAGYPRIEDVDPTRSLSPVRIWGSVGALARLIDKVGADIVHCHLSADHWLSYFAIQRAKDRPRLVRTVHNPRAAKANIFNKYLFNRSTDGVIGVNSHIAGILKNQLQVPAGRLHMVRGGVDIERFRPASIESRVNGRDFLKLPTKATLIGIVSRLASDRGYITLIEAFRLLAVEVPGVHLVIVGKGEYLPAIQERVGSLGLNERVHFPGYIEEELPEVLAGLDIFTLLAPGSEGTCRALLEAMAMGIPCVVTSHNGLDEVVRDVVTSYVVPPNNPGALSAAFKSLVTDKGKRIQFGRAGRQRVERHFYNGYRGEMVENVYAQVLGISQSPKEMRR